MRLNSAILFILLTCLSFSLNGQAIYSGHVSDIGDRSDIVLAKVEILHTVQESYTNMSGDFVLKNGPSDSLTNPLNLYRFFHNTLLWEGDPALSIQMISLDGRRVFEQYDLGNTGLFLLPRLEFGIYILSVHSVVGTMSYKAYSDGEQTFVVDPNVNRRIPVQTHQSDTLVFTAEGYFPRQIVLEGRDSLVDVKMLKGDYSNLRYFNELIDPIAYDLISTSPSRTNVGRVKAVKIMYHLENGLMYYINSKRFKYHFDFAKSVLNFNGGNSTFNQTQYLENPKRFLYPANLNYYEDLDIYVIHLVAANQMSCEAVELLYNKIKETSYFGDKLYFFPNKAEWEDCENIQKITSEELYAGQNYQALNLEENYGYLTRVELADLEETYLGRHDIVILNGIPNDVSVVAGIITTEFQTPLSHINILSHGRGTPNMALRDAWENPDLNALIGELVYLNVQSDSFVIRAASIAEAIDFWSQHEPQDTTYLSKNTQLSGLVDLETANYQFVDRIGGKAANFAELMKVKLGGQAVPTPEDAFAIPFHYYQQHIEKAGLDQYISQMLADPQFASNANYRKDQLEILRDSIKSVPLNPALETLVLNRIDHFSRFAAYRFRSSTNAEDLEDFSGAGLYNSHSAKQGNIKKTVPNAIRKVWASLWNWRAFEERSYYKIDHSSCAMGILVHRSFPDEDANGVLITENLYNENPGFIVNVQHKEHSIVFPEPGILHDQLILFAWSITPDENFMIEYLSHSNIPELNGERVMTDNELFDLGDWCMEIKEHYYYFLPHNCHCSFQDFGLDIEFKVDSEQSPRKLYIKQVRHFQ